MLASAALLGSSVAVVLAQAIDPSGAWRASPSAPPMPRADDAPPAAEVLVRGTKLPSRDAGSDRVLAQDARAVPGTFGEPLQVVESLPGVAPMVSGLPYFYVRGAPPANTGYFLDGIPLPALFHIGPGPSVVPPPLLDRIDFFPSNAPARFGRFAGGVIAAETAPPSPIGRGEASIRLFDSSAFVESPFDGRTSALVGGRYGYPDFLLSLFAPNLSIEYGDYTTRLTRALGPADTISLFAIGAFDREEDTSQNLAPIATQFHRIDLRYDHRWVSGGLRVATTFGYDRTSDVTSTAPGETFTSVGGRLRAELEQRVGERIRLSAGLDANATRSTYEFSDSPATASRPAQVGGAYVDLRFRPAAWVEIAPGVRVDAYEWTRASSLAIDPKLAVRVGLSPDVTWVSTFGIADQPPTSLFPVPGREADPRGGLQRTYQTSEGVEVRLPLALKGRLTGFYNVDHNMSDFISSCGTFAASCSLIGRVEGRTYGLEALLERPVGRRLGGWISYTVSRAERRVGAVPYLSPFDRTHVLSAVLQYDFGNDVRAGLRGTYYTGRPDFPTFAFGNAPTTFSAGPGQIAQHRLPAFYRLDARVDKRWLLGGGRWLSAVAEFFDLTLSKEAIDFRCQVLTGQCMAQTIGPVALPSVGVEGGF